MNTNPRGFCLQRNSYDQCQRFTHQGDTAVLCGHTQGFTAGLYLIGVYSYCELFTPFFAPNPPRSSHTAHGFNKDRCDPGIGYMLYATPFNKNCSVPLMEGPWDLAQTPIQTESSPDHHDPDPDPDHQHESA